MKLACVKEYAGEDQSHPARGAWIEMAVTRPLWMPGACRTPQGVRGLKSCSRPSFRFVPPSHPARGAWIEIPKARRSSWRAGVAPRKGCVD